MTLHVMPTSGAVCRVLAIERLKVRWCARVDYAWSWVKAMGLPVNGEIVYAWSKKGVERKAARAIARFHAHNGPSWEWTPEEEEELRRQMTESLRRLP